MAEALAVAVIAISLFGIVMFDLGRDRARRDMLRPRDLDVVDVDVDER